MNTHPQKTENPLLKECLFTALIKLMDQKDFKDIKMSGEQLEIISEMIIPPEDIM